MPSAASELAGLLILLSALLIFFAWWSRRLRKGIRVRPRVVALLGVFYLLLFLLVEAEVLRLPWGGVAQGAAFLDLLLLLTGVVPAYRYTTRTTTFERSSSDKWIYRGRLAIPAAWLAIFLLRSGVELALLGQISLFTPTRTATVTIPAFAAALILVDALFALSTGVLIGDYLAIYRAYRRLQRHGTVPVGVVVSADSGALVGPPSSGGGAR
ncbi:MAG: hypothetical protein L3J97_05570 [Thermoplasmata archaeon]|nr:hypothetical protein [Thermoplasmata archaeon]